jgi:hypothetical protein
VRIAAAECVVADALSENRFALVKKLRACWRSHRPDALLLERDGAPSWMFHSSCDTPTGLDSIEARQRYFRRRVGTAFFWSGAAWAY